ncbi:MAG: isoleucine--tRNA ligase [Thermoanaerobaculia bacterium]|nr:isoleucine--tRNA ligase [Thermoanaerobaculia bacterium]
MTDRRFPDVPSGYPFPAQELATLEFWRRERVFERSMAKPAPRGEWVLFEGPPTANNIPHVGHVPSRVAKDLFPRFRTMQGHHVARKAGWDTHGLPVEIEVEKRLGFSGKQQIEAFGIAEFNRACLDSVSTYEREWRAFTERLGYWTDLDHAYFTYTNEYIESVWWSLSELWKKNLLAKGYKIQPYCARCGTTLSSHEVAQNYKEADDPSVWVLFPARAGQTVPTVDGEPWTVPAGLELLAWTTTPWTLLAHVGLTVHPELVYRVIEHPAQPGTTILFGDSLAGAVPLEMDAPGGKRQRVDLRDQPVLARFRGRDLEGLRYDRPFHPPVDGTPNDDTGFGVVLGDYVTATDGSGLVHTAPRFGEDDYQTGKKYGLPLLATIQPDGTVANLPGLEAFAGMWFKDADPKIQRDLKDRGRLLHGERTVHNYPFCWRCDRPLLYFATESWFVRVTAEKDRLIRLNQTIHWHPEHVGEGRFGNWLENVVDWALSRRRYWGTPLPVWLCTDCPASFVPGSYAELFAEAGRPLPENPYDPAQFNPHRPDVDALTWSCKHCGTGRLERVPDVIDAWYDSGAMPFAQHHYPFDNRELFAQQFPADLVTEGVDQTRGWFYTLHVLGSLLFDSVAYKHCIVLGHINDEQGRKMSKRLGNVVQPMDVVAETGADALRFYLCAANPELTSRFSARLVRESAQGYLLPLWNALSFFTIYANLDGWRPGQAAVIPFERRPALDRWVLLALDRTAETVTAALEAFSIVDAARGLEGFLDGLTNWYIRRSRGRFWSATGDGGEDKESAYQTLYEVLTAFARLTAPITPFVAEELHSRLERSQGRGADSVHLEDWFAGLGAERSDPTLERAMAAVQRIVRLGHAARNVHSLKTRQPLAAVTLVTADRDLPGLIEPYADILREELNVKAIAWAADRGEYVTSEVKPIFPKLGPRFGKRMKDLAAALAAADGDGLAGTLEREGAIDVTLADGETVRLVADELEIRLTERAGTATQGDRELLVALDTTLTPELVAEGLAREVVNRLQTARKDADLDYADRIRVAYRADGELTAVIASHHDWIAGETLALELTPAAAGTDLKPAAIEEHDFAFALERVRPRET